MNTWVNKFLICFISLWNWAAPQGPLSCTVGEDYNNNKYPYLIIRDPIFDIEDTTIPYTYQLRRLEVSAIDYLDKYNFLSSPETNNENNDYLELKFSQINETILPSRETDEYKYKFDLTLHCRNDDVVTMHSVVTIVDTNNHKPFFQKPTYTYNLISSYPEDFKRQQFLNPIIATDYDITNYKLEFTLQDNEYFNVIYNGVVPNTLNKQHYALIVPKIPGTFITKKIITFLTATDLGQPPQMAQAKIIINPPSPPMPIFDKTFYIGHYYKNHTFVTDERPKLLEGVTVYHTKVEISRPEFTAFLKDEEIIISRLEYLIIDETMFYKRNYVACELTATYTDSVTKLYSSNRATFIVELHHDI